MTHIAEKFARNVAGCSPRFTNLALMLWLQRKKVNVSNQTGSFGNSRTLFLRWNDCWPPAFYNSLHLVCKMRAGRRRRGWALGCSGRRGLLPQETTGLGKKDSGSRMWEDISLSRAVLFCDFTKTTACWSRVLHRGTAQSRCNMSQLWYNKAASQLCLQPATSRSGALWSCKQRALWQKWGCPSWNKMANLQWPWPSCRKMRRLVEKWFVESLVKTTQILKLIWLVLAVDVFLTRWETN